MVKEDTPVRRINPVGVSFHAKMSRYRRSDFQSGTSRERRLGQRKPIVHAIYDENAAL